MLRRLSPRIRPVPRQVLDHLVIQRMDTSGRTVLGPGAATAAAKQMFGKVRAAATWHASEGLNRLAASEQLPPDWCCQNIHAQAMGQDLAEGPR